MTKSELHSVILAAGIGSRIRSLTEGTPKQLLKVGSECLVSRLLRQFSDVGIRKHIVCYHAHTNAMANYLRGLGGIYGDILLIRSLLSKGEDLRAMLGLLPDASPCMLSMGDVAFEDRALTEFAAFAGACEQDLVFGVSLSTTAPSGKIFDPTTRTFSRARIEGCPHYAGLARISAEMTSLWTSTTGVHQSISDYFTGALRQGATVTTFDVGNMYDINTPDAYDKCLSGLQSIRP